LKKTAYRFTGRFIGWAGRFPVECGRFHPVATDFLGGRPAIMRPPDSRLNVADFHPAAADFFGGRTAVAPRPIYQLSQPIPGFASALNRTEWGTMNLLFCRVGETEYHIHELWAKWANFYVFYSI
jgi:hypothetical protein